MSRDKDMEQRLQKILEFLTTFQDEYGYSPSIREIGDQINVNSTSLVDFYLDKLEARNEIQREKHISRSIRVLKPAYPNGIVEKAQKVIEAVENFFQVPLLGVIQAGSPIPIPSSDLAYFDSDEAVTIARSMLPAKENIESLFALRVQGDSMIDAMVNDGDIVVMKKAQDANNGEMVAVWLDDENSTTLKYFFKEKDGFRLQPANPTMQPIRISKNRPVRIMGKVVMIIRQFNHLPMAT